MTAAEQDRPRACSDRDGVRAGVTPRPRLGVKDALSICLAMVDDDRSLQPAAADMWHALAPFVPALTQADAEAALAALDALGEDDAPRKLRELRRRAARHDLVDVGFALDEWLAIAGTREPIDEIESYVPRRDPQG